MPPAWPRRPRLVAGNWKMHKTAPAGAALAGELASRGLPLPATEVVVCPAFPALEAVRAAIAGSRLHLGAQNLHPEPQGAFTGEVSGAMLAAVGCRFVIVGHSERRHGMGESDSLIAKKLGAALRDGLIAIVCVGETLAEREGGATEAVLARQVEAAFTGISEADSRATVIAYEPVWAIGTGRVASTEQARDAHRAIRGVLDRTLGEGVGQAVAVLYGGSVNPGNAAALFAEEDVDGVLVGGASLDAAAFWAITQAASQAAGTSR